MHEPTASSPLIRRRSRFLAASVTLLSLAAATVASAGMSSLQLGGAFDYARLHGLSPQHSGPAVAEIVHDGTDAPTGAAQGSPSDGTPGAGGAWLLAECGEGSHPEGDRQGRVPLAHYETGRAAEGYRCNAELGARFGQTGGYQVHRYVGHDKGKPVECAFYDSTLLWGKDLHKGAEPGVWVLDMSTNRKVPTRTAVLRTPAMQSPNESLRLNAARGLLVATAGSPITNLGVIDVYDVSGDCRFPRLRSSLRLAGLGHEGGFSPDGMTYWATATAAPGITAIGLEDPSSPTVVWRSTDRVAHGLSLSADGNRAYVAELGDYATATTQGGGGLTILDVTEVQARVAEPSVQVISQLTWPEVSIPQNAIPVRIDDREYLIQFDEFDSNLFGNDPEDRVGAVRIIDIDDDTQPRIVSRIRLQVHEPSARRGDQQQDPGASQFGQGYAVHYCAVPRRVDPNVVACSMILSGLRVFDIRDPERPIEVAYFNQPQVSDADPGGRGAHAMSAPAFAPERCEIWYSDANTGFFNVALTNHAAELLCPTS